LSLESFIAGLRALFYKERVEQELDQEIREYLEASAADKMRAGMGREQALRAARLELGSVDAVKEGVRDVGWERIIEPLWQDLRYAARIAMKDLGYTALAIAALAIGIGANTALFTLFAAVGLKPLPVPRPTELVSLWRTTPEHPRTGIFSFADYLYYRDHNSVFQGMAAESPAGLRLSQSGLSGSSGGAEPVTALFVTSNYFSTFAVRPVGGRDFIAEEEQIAAGPYPALLSENYWERRFGRDGGIIGQSLTIGSTEVTVIGITPRNFMGTRPEVPDVWINISALGNPQRRTLDRTSLCCAITARLKPAATVSQAQSDIAVLANSLRAEYPQTERQWSVLATTAAPFGPNHGNIVKMFVVLQVAMGLVLLIACTNVAGLLLGKTAARQREIAIRLSLGATRRRVVRQLVTEAVFISIIAGLSALLASWQILALVERMVASRLVAQGDTLALDLTPDLHVFFYALAVSILAGVSFALVPALQSSQPNLISALKEERAVFGVQRKSHLRAALVVAQITVCLGLLIGAGLLTSSSARLLVVDPGFETQTVLHLMISTPQNLSPMRAQELQRTLGQRLRNSPGILSVAAASRVPLGGNISTTRVAPQMDASSSPSGQQFPYTYVSEDYFQTLGIPLLHGRAFTAAEIRTSAPVAIVSDGLARRFWPNGEALGKHMALGSPTEVHYAATHVPLSSSTEIIGIARDIYSMDLNAPDPGAIYLPQPTDDASSVLLLRISGKANVFLSSVARQLGAVEPGLTISVQTLHDTINSGGMAATFRLSAAIFAAIGLIGFVLAAVGVYAISAYSVSQQTREVGIRMALGAQSRDIVWLLIRESAKSIAAGLLLGAGLGVILSLLLSSRFFLQGTRLLDPAVILAVSLLTGTLAMIASYLPVRRATKLDPAMTLRFE